MPTPIVGLPRRKFGLLAQPTQLTRKIAAVHVHHTWRPRRQDFRGLATVEAMRTCHMEQNGWSDLRAASHHRPPGRAVDRTAAHLVRAFGL